MSIRFKNNRWCGYITLVLSYNLDGRASCNLLSSKLENVAPVIIKGEYGEMF